MADDARRQRNARRWRERIARFRAQGARSAVLWLVIAAVAAMAVLLASAALGGQEASGQEAGGQQARGRATVPAAPSGSGPGGSVPGGSAVLAAETISNETGIAVGLAVVVIGSAISTAVWLTQVIGGLRAKIDESLGRLDALEREQMTVDRAAELALRQAIENPGHRVPDPRNPGKVVVVRNGERDDG